MYEMKVTIQVSGLDPHKFSFMSEAYFQKEPDPERFSSLVKRVGAMINWFARSYHSVDDDDYLPWGHEIVSRTSDGILWTKMGLMKSVPVSLEDKGKLDLLIVWDLETEMPMRLPNDIGFPEQLVKVMIVGFPKEGSDDEV